MPVLRVLFVDDDSDDYELFSDIAKEIEPDTNIMYVDDSIEIDDYLKPPLPDLILLDFNMPKVNGIDCLKKIRANKAFDKIPVVIYSVYYDRVDEAYKNGANYFIVKQTSVDKMRESIQTILKRNWEDEAIFKNFDVFYTDKNTNH